MCNDCFFLFPRKLKTNKCPACTQQINTYEVLTRSGCHSETFEGISVLEVFFNGGGKNSFAEIVAQ
jgi:hypothetical protein